MLYTCTVVLKMGNYQTLQLSCIYHKFVTCRYCRRALKQNFQIYGTLVLMVHSSFPETKKAYNLTDYGADSIDSRVTVTLAIYAYSESGCQLLYGLSALNFTSHCISTLHIL